MSTNFNIKATATQNADGSTTIAIAAQSFKIPAGKVQPPPDVQITANMPNGKAGVAYSGQLTGSGGKAPYSYAFTPALPSGMALDQSTGKVTGAPTAQADYSGTAAAVDANKQGATCAVAFSIAAADQQGGDNIGAMQDGDSWQPPQ